jgi:hypothetical protein
LLLVVMFARYYIQHRRNPKGFRVFQKLCRKPASDYAYSGPRVVCVDPYPTPFLRAAAEKQEIRLIAKSVELLNYSILAELSAGDI